MIVVSDFSQIRELAVDLGKAGAAATVAASKVVRKAGAEVERGAKRLAPVDTGNLRNSIGTSQRGPLTVEVGPTAAYGAYVEFGTYRMRAQPYMGPATDAAEPGFLAAMELIAGDVL